MIHHPLHSQASRDLANGIYSHGCSTYGGNYPDDYVIIPQEHGSTLIDHPIKDAPEVHVRTGLERFLNSKLGKKYVDGKKL